MSGPHGLSNLFRDWGTQGGVSLQEISLLVLSRAAKHTWSPTPLMLRLALASSSELHAYTENRAFSLPSFLHILSCSLCPPAQELSAGNDTVALKSEGTQDRALWLLSSLLTSCVISGKKLNLLLSAGITGLHHPTRFIPVLGIKPRALCLLGMHPANGVATPAKPHLSPHFTM